MQKFAFHMFLVLAIASSAFAPDVPNASAKDGETPKPQKQGWSLGTLGNYLPAGMTDKATEFVKNTAQVAAGTIKSTANDYIPSAEALRGAVAEKADSAAKQIYGAAAAGKEYMTGSGGNK